MSLCIFLLWLVSIPLVVHAIPDPRGYLINCGGNDTEINDIRYIPDEGYIEGGKTAAVQKPDLIPILSSLRYFPDESARKYCFGLSVIRGGRYLVRTTYYYGNFDGGKEPPVFDQIIGGTKWVTVDTAADYGRGMATYYEIVVAATGKVLHVCLARSKDTTGSPFINVLEVEYLEDSLYNATDFKHYALATVARQRFGVKDETISFPDDQFNRYWHPFMDQNPVVASQSNVTASDFWNIPPVRAFQSGLTTSRGKSLHIQWPPVPLPDSVYYISLYFQDNRTPSPYSWRVFSVSVNGKTLYSNLNATTKGVTVYSAKWPLSGKTEIVLTPDDESPVGPIVNAAEILQLVPLAGRTATRDVIPMEALARSFDHPPSDWVGDPCLPEGYSWTGVVCSYAKKLARVVALNLTNAGLSGVISPSIGNLTAVTELWLGGNKLSGPIPDLSMMKALQTLHLEDNQLEGSIPASLSLLPNLREIYLQNNKIDGVIPEELLQKRNDINIQVSSENNQSA